MTEYSNRMNKNKKYEFSFEPKSLWTYENNKLLENICDTNYGKEKSIDRIKSGRGTFMSGWNKEFQKRLIEYYTIQKETILDPFAGHSSSFIPYLMNRNFIGFEITKERYEIQINHLNKLKLQYNSSSNIRLYNDSSENLNHYIQNELVDCILTDPPFWNVEKYGSPVKGTQLSDIKNYEIFLNNLFQILKLSYDKLRDGGFLLLKLADFRKNGMFFDLTGDMINKLKTVDNLNFIDKIVLELNPSKRHPLYIQAITNKNMLKVQEYILVFRKIINVDVDDDNDRINHNRKLVSDVYSNESVLFWSKIRNKKDYITEELFDDNKLNCLFEGNNI